MLALQLRVSGAVFLCAFQDSAQIFEIELSLQNFPKTPVLKTFFVERSHFLTDRDPERVGTEL